MGQCRNGDKCMLTGWQNICERVDPKYINWLTNNLWMGCQNMYIYQLDDNIYPPLFQMGFLLLLLMFGSALAAPDKSEKAQVRLRGRNQRYFKSLYSVCSRPLTLHHNICLLNFLCFSFNMLYIFSDFLILNTYSNFCFFFFLGKGWFVQLSLFLSLFIFIFLFIIYIYLRQKLSFICLFYIFFRQKLIHTTPPLAQVTPSLSRPLITLLFLRWSSLNSLRCGNILLIFY